MAGTTQLLSQFPHKLGKYEILEKIGEGGYSCVYRGFDPLIKRPVAIKTCPSDDGETRERFYREAQIAGNLDHPNIVTVYDLFLEDGAPYLVQELLSGTDLDVKIERRELISFPEKLFFLLQIARGLEFAHSRGVIHRDVKPANVRILEDGSAKILDFGIAKLIHHTSDLTQVGMTVGTAAYLSPEQIRGEEATPETDIFSFGVLAYELLTYVRPFGRETISETFYQTLNRQPTALTVHWAQCPPGLVEIVNRCLRKDPSQRYGSCRLVVRDLEELRDALRGEWSPGADPAATQALKVDPDLLHAEPPPRSDSGVTAAIPSPSSGAPPREPAVRTARGAQADLPLRGRPRGMSISGSTHKRRRSKVWLLGPLLVVALGAAAWPWLPGSPWGTRLKEIVESFLIADGEGAARLAAGDATPEPDAGATPQPVAATDAEPERAAPAPKTPAAETLAPPPTEFAPPDGEETPVEAEAAPQPAPEPKPATVAFERVWTPGIQVSVNGAPPISLGRSRKIELQPGSHSLTFSLDGGGYSTTRTLRLSVDAGESRSLTVPIAPPGQLTVQAHLGAPQGTVSIDGGRLQPTPLRGLRLAPGPHQLALYSRDRPGVPRIQTSVEVRSGQESVVTFDLASGRAPHVRERPAK
jgi:serine/threonine-protein kinase